MMLTRPTSWLFCEQYNELTLIKCLACSQQATNPCSHHPPLRVLFGTPRSPVDMECERARCLHGEACLRCLKCPDYFTKAGGAWAGTESHSHALSGPSSPSPCRRPPSASELVFTSFLKSYFLLGQRLPATSLSPLMK